MQKGITTTHRFVCCPVGCGVVLLGSGLDQHNWSPVGCQCCPGCHTGNGGPLPAKERKQKRNVQQISRHDSGVGAVLHFGLRMYVMLKAVYSTNLCLKVIHETHVASQFDRQRAYVHQRDLLNC